MKQQQIDAALITVLGLLVLVSALHSATGGERVAVMLSSIVLSWAAIVVSCILVGYRRHTKRTVSPAVIGSVFCLTIIISVGATCWPLRASYALSRDALSSLAQRVRAGERITTPVRAGFFIVRRAELSHQGIVCLWTDPDPGGSTGFVQCRGDVVPFNLWSLIRLDESWQFISED